MHISALRRKITLVAPQRTGEFAMAYPVFFAKLFSARVNTSFLPLSVFLFIAGCNSSTCFVGIINPPNNSFKVNTGNLPSVCSGLQMPAAMIITAQLAPVCTGCSATRQVSGVELSVSGVELHSGAVVDENSPDWQEIAPNLSLEPLQLKLQQHPASGTLALPAAIMGQIPAGTYYQLRLRLADPTSLQAMQLPAKNSCGAAGANCLFTASGDVHTLRSLGGSLYLRVVVSSPIDVRAGQPNLLRIELGPEWLLQNSSTGATEVAPLLRGRILSETVPSTGSL